MIRKFTFGSPLSTDAVTVSTPVCTDSFPYFSLTKTSSFLYHMDDKTRIYGLGEAVRGINKRGWIYESFASDDCDHSENKRSLYGAHNFLIIDSEKDLFGVFFDYPARLTFDIGYTLSNQLLITPLDANLDIYFIESEDINDIVTQFRQLIGQSYIAPKWALGYGQSRWGYKNADDIRTVVRRHREEHLPLDSVYLDIDYMEKYKDFTVDENRFPDFSSFVEEMKQENIHLVPIIDAGIKIEKGYSIYEEGVHKNYFCKNEDGTDFTAAVWPGHVCFPDFLNPAARRWFGQKYNILLTQGIDGFWNDMNEPAIFYTPERLAATLQELGDYCGKNLGVNEFFELRDKIKDLSNSDVDYRSFYHNADGNILCHDKVHNLYGYNMTRSAFEAFEELLPEKRILIFSRSSYVGMHRYGGIWTGDNMSVWGHILLTVKMLPSLNMCGFLYIGADLGGFGENTTEDLLLRFLALGIFTPLMRNHSALGTREQEIYQFEKTDAFRRLLSIRYGLLPYLYSEYVKASLKGKMLFRPMRFVYPEDSRAAGIEDQLMLSDELMITPVYEQNAEGRYVYLPEKMRMIRMRSLTDYDTVLLSAGDHYIDIPLDTVVFFLRPNCIIPLSAGGENITEVSGISLKLLGYVTDTACYVYYDDNGYEKDYNNPAHYNTIRVDPTGNILVTGERTLDLTIASI